MEARWFFPPDPEASTRTDVSVGSIHYWTLSKDAKAPRLPDGKEFHIFFSYLAAFGLENQMAVHNVEYPSRDEEWVRRVVGVLESDKYGYRCCLPARDYRPGSLTMSESEDKIKKALKAVIVLSKEYLQSASKEIERATILGLNIPCIPVRLDSCPVPESLQKYCLSKVASDKHWWRKFLRSIRGDAPCLDIRMTEHAFFAHGKHKEDSKWVKTTIAWLRSLDNALRCVSAYEDFTPGSSEAKSIQHYISQSMITFVIMTRNFKDEAWKKYRDHILSDGVNYVPVLVHADAPIPRELDEITYLDATNYDDQRWRGKMSDIIVCKGYSDKTLLEPTSPIAELAIDVRLDSSTRQGEDPQQTFQIQFVHGIPAKDNLSIPVQGLCCGINAMEERAVEIHGVDITPRNNIAVCLTLDRNHHMLAVLDFSGELVWKRNLKQRPYDVKLCTEEVVFVHFRLTDSQRSQSGDIIEVISSKKLSQKTKIPENNSFTKLYCMAVLNTDYLLVSDKGRTSVQTISIKDGKCKNYLYVRPHPEYDLPQTPKHLAISSSGNLLVANVTTKIFCYAPFVLSRGIYREPCLWVVDVTSPACIACGLDDLTLVLSSPSSQMATFGTDSQTSPASDLVILDEKGKEGHRHTLLNIEGACKIACGPQGSVVILHKDEHGHCLLLSHFSLRVYQSQRL